jgi:hypothetical protein
MFDSLFAAGIFHEDPPHRFGGRGKEVSPAFPTLWLFGVDKPHVSLMDQSRWLKGQSLGFVLQSLRRQTAQLIVDQRQQFFGRRRIAGLNL